VAYTEQGGQLFFHLTAQGIRKYGGGSAEQWTAATR